MIELVIYGVAHGPPPISLKFIEIVGKSTILG
jgi:hypothetical protein